MPIDLLPTATTDPPRMDNLLSMRFEAHHDANNHHRHYAVTLGRDLLDDWTVAIRYGRTGQAGRELQYASPQPEEIKAIIRNRLRRRLSAPKRIGCAYRLAAYSAAPGFDAADWLPGDVMARFFSAAELADDLHGLASPSLPASAPDGHRRPLPRFGQFAYCGYCDSVLS
jgi:predicted DNA-binding WGR domain protein